MEKISGQWSVLIMIHSFSDILLQIKATNIFLACLSPPTFIYRYTWYRAKTKIPPWGDCYGELYELLQACQGVVLCPVYVDEALVDKDSLEYQR